MKIISSLIIVLLTLTLCVTGCDNAVSDSSATIAQSVQLKPHTRTDQKNIIVFTLDTTRADYLGSGGHPDIYTPYLDRFAQGNYQFPRTYTQAPRTVESHASIFTGLYPFMHQAANPSGLGTFPMPEEFTSLAEILQSNGYATAAFTSSAMVKLKVSGLEQGFDLYADYAGAELKADRNNTRFFKWLETHKTENFFVWMHYYDPHIPYMAPEIFQGMYDIQPDTPVLAKTVMLQGPKQRQKYTVAQGLMGYLSEISFMDHHFGKLLQRLAEENLLNDTVVVAIADHGESMYEHNIFFDHGYAVFEPSMRIPFFMQIPGNKTGRLINNLTETVDVVPTVLSTLGIPSDVSFQGRDLAALIRDPGMAWRSRIFGQKNHHSPKILQIAVRDDRWTYIQGQTNQNFQLYDRSKDPQELRDLAKSLPKDFDREGFDSFILDVIKKKDQYPSSTQISLPLDKKLEDQLKVLGYIK